MEALFSIKSPKNLTDEEIVREIVASQNPDFVGVLYERYTDKIFRKAISFVKDKETAEDLTHDIFLKILLSLASFKGKSKFSTWVYSVTYNFCIDYLRKRQKHRFSSMSYDMADDNEPIDDIDDTSAFLEMKVSRLQEVLELLNIDEKMILLMKYKDGLSIKQIQTAFDLSESAVKMRIKRAKEKVQKLYKEKYKD